jgi:type IV pilus assembly protein PilB
MPNNYNENLQNAIMVANIPSLVMSAINYAVLERSSDIHIEPCKNFVRIRYRIDGVLRVIVEYPLNLHPAVVSRIKILANLKIDEQRIPQDGRAQVTTEEGKELDLRVSTLPTIHGEKIVMRIQDESRTTPSLEDLGIEGGALEELKASLKEPNGIILTSGPTGSGKTTTLYACLNILNKTDVNILTIEDPVEIQMDGLNQSQTHSDIDYTFATGLRTALRQDPNIIMVGEIRDKETINIAIEASLTGHLVLSTIHTNSAVETLTRILNMGIPAFLMASTIRAIIAQRLVRKLCQDCKQKTNIDEKTIKNIKKALEKIPNGLISQDFLKNPVFYEAKGCEKCSNIGFLGRVGLYEFLNMDDGIKKYILEGKTSLDIKEKAMELGMVSLEQIGLIKASKGITSLSEVYRVASHE